jgi:aspartyl-tRNA(Asn)/glutamyl-tRNA(Gln) amidotransferase subunit C
MPLSREQVEHVAKLARLNLTPFETEKFTHELTVILSYIDQLALANVDGIDPQSRLVSAENVFRQDTVRPSLSQEAALQNAPKRDDGYFVVPKVIG